jgi:succinate-semialdehyde dehydrogenase/glutarate-semialdehyde dehydrogenase
MVSERQAGVVEAHIARAVEQGASVRIGGRRSEQALQLLPTVLTGCRQDMSVMRDEIFGPVMPIMRVDDEQQAVALANDSRFGLMAYVFTRDRAKGRRLAESLEAGSVMVNDCLLTFAMPETPWAGLKQSGIGRTHAEEGLRDLCQARHVNDDRVAFRRELWWYPYSERLRRKTLAAMGWLFR